jgi:large subunit ribosomal protein L21
MYALFEIKGKQYKAEKGSILKIDRLETEKENTVEFDSVLMISDDQDVKVGAPYVSGAKVTATVEDHKKDKKVIVFKYRRRKHYRKKYGHRQPFTVIKIADILN